MIETVDNINSNTDFDYSNDTTIAVQAEFALDEIRRDSAQVRGDSHVQILATASCVMTVSTQEAGLSISISELTGAIRIHHT